MAVAVYNARMSSFDIIESKMQGVGLSGAAISAFRHSVQVLESKQSMLIPEEDIQPAEGVADWEELVAATPAADAELLAQSVLIKLNGGLGTSMGLQKAKSLLEIKPGVTFLDLIVRQVQSLRSAAGYPVNLLLMNSFSTADDTMAHLSRYEDGGFAAPDKIQMLQNRVPKLRTDTLEPVSYPANPELEWCPPGHGDIYPALVGSGWLDKLLAAGVKYAFVSNSDNLGAQMDTRFLRWLLQSSAGLLQDRADQSAQDDDDTDGRECAGETCANNVSNTIGITGLDQGNTGNQCQHQGNTHDGQERMNLPLGDGNDHQNDRNHERDNKGNTSHNYTSLIFRQGVTF